MQNRELVIQDYVLLLSYDFKDSLERTVTLRLVAAIFMQIITQHKRVVEAMFVSLLAQRLRRWSNTKTTLVQRLVSGGNRRVFSHSMCYDCLKEQLNISEAFLNNRRGSQWLRARLELIYKRIS